MPDRKNLLGYRLLAAEENLKDAKSLYMSGSFKGSNNRSYYAIFNILRAFLALDGVDFKKHSGVIAYFNQKYIKEGLIDKEYSMIIKSASLIRNQSDYDDFYIASREEAEEQIENAEKMMKLIRTYIKAELKDTD